MELKHLELKQVKPNPFQPREKFKKEELQDLADNIKTHGLIEPIVVTPKGKNYMIVAGERRWRAHQLAKQKKVFAIVKDYATDADIKRDSLIENELRENLNYDEFKNFCFSLAKSLGPPFWQKGYVNGYALAKYILGKPDSSKAITPIANKINDIFKIETKATPKLKKLVKEGRIDRRTATNILSVKDKSVQNKLADMAKNKSNNEIREEVKKHNFEQLSKEVAGRISKQNLNKSKSASEDMWLSKIETKIDDWDLRMNDAISTLKVCNNKKFWQAFSQESRMSALDTLKPLKRDTERLLHIVSKIMETIGGL